MFTFRFVRLLSLTQCSPLRLLLDITNSVGTTGDLSPSPVKGVR